MRVRVRARVRISVRARVCVWLGLGLGSGLRLAWWTSQFKNTDEDKMERSWRRDRDLMGLLYRAKEVCAGLVRLLLWDVTS